VPGLDTGSTVVPVLQAQDGSYVGTFEMPNPDGPPNTYMVAFDQSGSVRWTVEGYTPQIATADGGVIATDDSGAAVTFDQNGNATGQMNGLFTQSWRGNIYRQGSVERLFLDAILMAQSLWANQGGGPSKNGAAGRPWEFKIVWRNDCSAVPWPCGFHLYPDYPDYLVRLAVDATAQAGTIKAAALDALKSAFDKYPVRVTEGKLNTGDHRANVVDGYVFDAKLGVNSCGTTNPFVISNDSNIYYQANMEQAQWALPLTLKTLADVQAALNNRILMMAIGTGIGNNAAHEIAHQFFLAKNGMDDTSQDTYNGQSCRGDMSPWVYGIGMIQWEGIAADALKKELGAGWHH